MYIDRARMRNRVITDVWNEMNDLPYAKESHWQGNGTRGRFVEVMVNGAYAGLYCLTDKINRKKLNLKKTKTEKDGALTHRGVLYKGKIWTSATQMRDYTEGANESTLTWEGWEQKYPDESPSYAYWEPMKELLNTVSYICNPQTSRFEDRIETLCYLNNVVDYMLLMHSFRIEDNQLKNAYISYRNRQEDSRMLLTPWDMDASFGRTWDGRTCPDDPEYWGMGKMLRQQCILFYRLLDTDAGHFKQRLHDRWNELQLGVLAPEAVGARLDAYAALFESSGAWERERALWPEFVGDLQEEIAYCKAFYARNTALMEERLKDFPATDVHTPNADADWQLAVRPDGLHIQTAAEGARVSVTDLLGRQWFQTATLPATCTGLPRGVYIVHLTADGRHTARKIAVP